MLEIKILTDKLNYFRPCMHNYEDKDVDKKRQDEVEIKRNAAEGERNKGEKEKREK
jgi:hypothetical protein